MARPSPRESLPAPNPPPVFDRLGRSPSLTMRTEQLLREAIASGRFPDGRLPTEVELAEQLGVSRETIRLAAEALQREGLLVKIRRKGTFLQPPAIPGRIESQSTFLGYLQAGYQVGLGRDESPSRSISGMALQGALEEASRAGFRLIVHHAPYTQIGRAFRQLLPGRMLRGLIFAHYGEGKWLRQAAATGLPVVLLDHDLQLPEIHSVRDDSFAGARQGVGHLASLGHRRVAFVNWHQTELNPWRLQGYRQALREAKLPRRRAWELTTELTPTGAVRVATQFLQLSPRPTALYCFNNSIARLVIAELERRGLSVPGDVSVLGGGGEVVPGLTCHQADWEQLGRQAVQILLRALTAPRGQSPEHLLSEHSLHPGRTVAPCP